MMSYTEKLQAAFLSIKSAKRQDVPDAVQKKLLQWAAAATAETAPHLNAIYEGLKFHAEMLNIPAFSFSPLQINWPSNPQSPLSHYTQAVQRRNAITQQLEKDGVAILLSPDPKGESYTLSMEDMKGREHHLLMVSVKNKGFVETTFHLGNENSIQVPALDIREWDSLNSQLPAEAIQRIEPFLKRLLMIRPQGSIQAPELKPLWNCDKNGVEHSRGGEPVFPVIGGIVSSITHEQCRKIAPDLLSYLSNAARKGPTYSTISKATQSLLDEHKNAPWTGESLRKELMHASSAFAGGPIGEQLPAHFLDHLAAQLHAYPPAQRNGLLIRAVMRSGVMFNAKASVERKHDPLSLTTPHKTQTEQKPGAGTHTEASRAPNAANTQTTEHKPHLPPRRETPSDPVQAGQETALLELFQAYHNSLTAPQLARKFLEVAHPFGLLPLSAEDIRVIDSIIETMKRTPSRAVHGVRWLMDVVRDAQLNMLEQAPAPSTTENAPQHEMSPTPLRR